MRKIGDRKDATLIRDIDPMHYCMPLMHPNRCNNEAYLTMDVELDKLERFIRERNAGRAEEDKYTMFGIIIAGILKTIYNRPQLNRFIANDSIFQRNKLTAAFLVKQSFSDDSPETLAQIEAFGKDTLASIQKKVNEQINFCRTHDDETSESMGIIKKLPFKHWVGRIARWADRHGFMPQSIIATDPYQCTVLLSNLGSIGLGVGYHHLMDWGTNSIFVVVGKKSYKAHYDRNGNVTTKRVVNLSFTIDERISDGFYFGKSLRMLKKYIENPETMLENFDCEA